MIARNRNAAEALLAPMASFAGSPEALQTVKALSRHLNRSAPTIYRRFGHRSPVGGAYVMALCVLVGPARDSAAWFAEDGAALIESHDGGVVFLRAFARAFLAPLLSKPALTARAHRSALAGVELRPGDLLALRGAESLTVEPVTLEGGPQAVEYIPVIVDACRLVLERTGRSPKLAVELAQALVAASFGCAEGNVNGATNRFLDRALPLIGVERTPPGDALDQAWLLTQLAERLALQGVQHELAELYHLIKPASIADA